MNSPETVNAQSQIESITKEVVQKIGNPVNSRVVLATLESLGYRDQDIRNDVGFDSLIDFSHYIYTDLKQRDGSTLRNENELKNSGVAKTLSISDYLWIKSKLLFHYYPLGIFHLLPVFIQIVSIVLFGYSLWTYLGFNIIQSTAVVIGVILGLTVSGGYVQLIGRQASFYWHHEEYYKAKTVIDRMMWAGIKGLLTTCSILVLVNIFFKLYPLPMVLIAMVYGFLIGWLLLVMAPFHAIKQRWFNSLVILASTLLALYLAQYTDLHIYFTHWIGITFAILCSILYLNIFFKVQIKKKSKINIKPRAMMVLYRNYPYFFYGFLIYVFIFLDRILAWSADVHLNSRFILLYEKNYEIGMDIAIVMFFLLSGVLEYAIASFTKFMDIRQKSTMALERENFNAKLRKMYHGHIFLLFLTALITTSIIYFFVTQSWGYQASFGQVLDPISIMVCIIGGLGYLLLTWGMLNALYLFCLNRPNGALNAIIISCVVNFAFGFMLSRMVGYQYSALGMLIGSAVFAWLTYKETKKYFKKLDYHYYASY